MMKSREACEEMTMIKNLQQELRQNIDVEFAKTVPIFFKTGKGQYAEGEQFLGVRMPALRRIIKTYVSLDNTSINSLLDSPWHEEKMSALLLLLEKYQTGNQTEQKQIYQFYAANRTRICNWDFVDNTAAPIVGAYHYHRQTKIPKSWINEDSLWARRIAIVATHYFIKKDCYVQTLDFAQRLFGDSEDLIHKATGWMLREVGKRDRDILTDFVRSHASQMPRTTLRYAIEHYSKNERKEFMTIR